LKARSLLPETGFSRRYVPFGRGDLDVSRTAKA
jgi:hypothetical protein